MSKFEDICSKLSEFFDHKNTTGLLVQKMTVQIDPGVEDVEERVHDFLTKQSEKYFLTKQSEK